MKRLTRQILLITFIFKVLPAYSMDLLADLDVPIEELNSVEELRSFNENNYPLLDEIDNLERDFRVSEVKKRKMDNLFLLPPEVDSPQLLIDPVGVNSKTLPRDIRIRLLPIADIRAIIAQKILLDETVYPFLHPFVKGLGTVITPEFRQLMLNAQKVVAVKSAKSRTLREILDPEQISLTLQNEIEPILRALSVEAP